MHLARTAIIALFAVGCATADRVQQLEDRVDALEKKVDSMPAKGGKGAQAAADPAAEEKAKALYTEVTDAMGKGDMETAKAKMGELTKNYSTTTVYRRAKKTEAELSVIGKQAPTDWNKNIEKWFQGEGEADLSKGTNLVVFWEVWCPHCRREVPNLKETYTKFHDKGLDVVGFTKISRSATEEKVTDFLKEQEVNYPIAKENGQISKYFNVSGIPAAAVIKDGKVVWRGHPGRLNDDLIQGWLK